MRIHKNQKVFLLTLLAFVACFCKASSPKWNEIHTIKGKINFFRTGEYGQLVREIQKKGPKINYAEAFMLGKAYFALKKYRESAAWFSRSVYHSKSKPRKNHASYLRSYLSSWGNLFKEYSPLAAEALYHVALCHHQLGAYGQAIQFLDMMEEHLNEELREKYWELKARTLTKISGVRGLRLYEKLIQKYKKIHLLHPKGIHLCKKQTKAGRPWIPIFRLLSSTGFHGLIKWRRSKFLPWAKKSPLY